MHQYGDWRRAKHAGELLGKRNSEIKSTSRIHQVSVSLFFSQFNLFTKRISQCFPAVIQNLSHSTYSSRNISQFSHWQQVFHQKPWRCPLLAVLFPWASRVLTSTTCIGMRRWRKFIKRFAHYENHLQLPTSMVPQTLAVRQVVLFSSLLPNSCYYWIWHGSMWQKNAAAFLAGARESWTKRPTKKQNKRMQI